MKRMERLIQARQQQRDVAADALSQARARLDQLARAQAALLQEQRDQFSGSVGTAALTPAQLESMDTAGRCARQATSCSEVEMQAAREAALQTQQSLRQLEILRSRARSEREQVLRRRERRELDEIASQAKRRLRALLPTLLLIVAAGTSAGCSEETPPAESEKAEVKPEAADKQEQAEEPKCPDEVFTAEELLVLRKLRDRRQGLLAAEQKLATERAKLALTQRKTKEMLDQIESWQSRQTDPRPKPGRVNLVKVLKGMNMRSAAAMLAQMDPGTVAAALTQLEPAEVSRLLAKMPPESAAAVGARLSVRDRRPRADKVSDKPSDDQATAKTAKTTKTAGGESETAAAGPKAKAKAKAGRPKAARPKAARPKAARPKAARPKAAKLPAKAPRREAAAAAAVKPPPAPAAAAAKAQPKKKATTMETTPKAAPAAKAGAGLGPKKTTEKRER
jgi:flagellar motility protein MotE (MotC chaperone)